MSHNPPRPVRFVTANMDKERSGDRAYTRHLLTLAGRPAVLMRQEVGHGLGSTRVRGIGVRVVRGAQLVVGRVGVHRGVARGRARIGGRWVRVLSVHGLHVRTSGKVAQDRYYSRLAYRTRLLNERGVAWVIGGDYNRPVRDVARMLGGTPHGAGIIGFVVSPGLTVTAEGIDGTGEHRGWTDHPAFWIDVTTAAPPTSRRG